AAGGALGGVLVAVVAPAVFSDYFELHWGILLCGGLFLGICVRDLQAGATKAWAQVAWTGSALALAGLGFLLWGAAHKLDRACVYRARNFYGVLRVGRYEYADPRLNQVELVHGRIAHGMQYLHESRAGQPTLYYSPETGIGRTFRSLPPGPRRVGVVGLGAGTVAAYAQTGDTFRFYEINPEVETVARRDFSYLRQAPGEMAVILGDARLSLERESPQQFDLLILDAFNSDAIPIHLLTREAFAVYQRHLKTNGVIAVHITNASLNLEPVVLSAARQFGYAAATIQNEEADTRNGVLPSTWMVLSQNRAVMEAAVICRAARPPAATASALPLWTDDFSGLFPVLRWERLSGTKSKMTEPYVQVAASVKSNQVASALAERREAVRRDPTSAAALNNLACLLATAPDPALRDGAEAVRLAEQACAATENRNTVMLTTLAAAYAEAGRFEDAVATAEKACALATEKSEQKLLDRNRELLQLYRRKEAYHQVGL
ncbi:MAG TPA: fused MFS/spermidine synthase, partial [Candidatus Sulfotelmatobacter sp.]|nr:fused MFS/spermidine synthase [Candidatus Sulfotelmatobacter sp.]